METNIELKSRNLVEEMKEIREIGPKFEGTESNRPLRNYASHRLRNAHFLKQFEEVYQLYDCVGDHINKDVETLNSINTHSLHVGKGIGLLSLFTVFGFLLLKKQNPFKFESYFNQVYNVPIVFGLTYSLLRFIDARYKAKFKESYAGLYHINFARAQLHSYSTKLFNELKYDISDLI